MPITPTIEIRTYSIDWLGGYVQFGAHNYLVYTHEVNGQVRQDVFSAYPDHRNVGIVSPFGSLHAESREYSKGAHDFQTSGYRSSIVSQGAATAAQWAAIQTAVNDINNAHLSYEPADQNSNAAVVEALRRAGITVASGQFAFTNGLFTPSDDGLFVDPRHLNQLFGSSSADGSIQPVSSAIYDQLSFGEGLSGGWHLAEVQVSGYPASSGWYWQDTMYVHHSPIVLDLDRDGLELKSINTGPLFDWNGDGYKQATGWIKGGDAFLVYDANGNGIVDNGRELAFTGYSPGSSSDLQALQVFDDNNDAVIDASDSIFDKLRVWTDTNEDGFTNPEELLSLTAVGISAIQLHGDGQDGYSASNYFFESTSVHHTDGTMSCAYDLAITTSARGSISLGSVQIDDPELFTGYKWNATETDQHEIIISNYSGLDIYFMVDYAKVGNSNAVAIMTGSGNDSLYTSQEFNNFSRGYYINSGEGDDLISLVNGVNNVIETGPGDDYITLNGNGDDLITPGTGYNGITDLGGNDFYRVQRNSITTISDAAGNDIIEFMDYSSSEVIIGRGGNGDLDLIINANDGLLRVEVGQFFLRNSNEEVESFAFKDLVLFSKDIIPALGGYGDGYWGREATGGEGAESMLMISDYMIM